MNIFYFCHENTVSYWGTFSKDPQRWNIPRPPLLSFLKYLHYSFVFVNLFFRHGGIIGYELSTNQKKFEYDFNECNDTQAVAVYNDILVAGFRDGSVKVIY